MIKDINTLLHEHPFFCELPAADVRLLSSCARNIACQEDQMLGEEGQEANEFFVIRQGRVAVETYVPERDRVVLQTLREGDIAGWSWLFPPYRWAFSMRALEDSRVISFDGKCLREKCESDPALGYRLMKKFAQVMTSRLKATRLQLLDVYGPTPGKVLTR